MLAEKNYILTETDLYKILGVDTSADVETITRVYKSLAKQYHPDIIRTNSEKEKNEAKLVFTKMTTAFNTLKDPDQRKKYDYEQKLKQELEKAEKYGNAFAFTSQGEVKSTAKKDKPITISIKINSNTVNTNVKAGSSAPSQNQTTNTPPQTQAEIDAKNKEREEKNNEQAETLYNSAMSLLSNGDIDAAIMQMQTVTVLNTKVAKYHSCLGLMMKEKGWNAYAQAEFKKALNLDPKDRLALKHYEAPAENNPATPKQNGVIKDIKVVTKNDTKIKTNKGLIASIIEFFSKMFKKS